MSVDAKPEAPSLGPGITRPLVTALWVYAVGYLPMLAAYLGGPIPAWVMPAVGVLAGIFGCRLARREWSPRAYDPGLSRSAERLAIATGLVMGGWFYYAATVHPLTAAAWLALLTLPLGIWYWLLYRWAVLDTQDAVADHWAAVAGNPEQRPPNAWEIILAQAGLPGVTAQAVDTPAGVTLTVRPDPQRPVKVSEIAEKAAAIALRTAYARPDIELREDDVRVEPAAVLPCALVHISWRRPLRASIPYVPAGPADINDSAALGVNEVGETVAVRLAAQNGKTVSATDGGKTVETNVKIARITECDNALVWIGACEKLLPLVYPWLRPWLAGKMDGPVLDAVAGEDRRDVCDMLADVYHYVKWRNARNTRKSKHVPSRDKPGLIVILEEATGVAKIPGKTIRTFDGMEWTASALLERICATCRSAGVAVYFLNQSGTVDALGNLGTEINRHLNLRICGRTNSIYDGSGTLPALKGSVDTTRLRDNTMLMQPHREEPRVFPWKAYYLEDDELIEPIAIRNLEWKPRLEPEIAAQLRWYPHRWDDGRLPDLVRECQAEGFAWPGTRGAPVRDDPEMGEGGAAAMTAARRIEQGVDETIDTIRAITATLPKPVPEPLATIARLLDAPDAPREWVSTAKLAVQLGRVPAGADEQALGDAAWKLGTELSALVPGLKTTGPRRVGDGRKRNGYDVSRLRAAVAAVKAGEPLAPEADETAAV